MIPFINALEQPIIEQLMGCDPVLQEYRALFRPTGLERGAGTG
jgi:hypothetical protein